MYTIVGLGLEWQPIRGFVVDAMMQWPFGPGPVDYWPMLGLGVRGALPRVLPKDPRR